jgi:hypothetical protein
MPTTDNIVDTIPATIDDDKSKMRNLLAQKLKRTAFVAQAMPNVFKSPNLNLNVSLEVINNDNIPTKSSQQQQQQQQYHHSDDDNELNQTTDDDISTTESLPYFNLYKHDSNIVYIKQKYKMYLDWLKENTNAKFPRTNDKSLRWYSYERSVELNGFNSTSTAKTKTGKNNSTLNTKDSRLSKVSLSYSQRKQNHLIWKFIKKINNNFRDQIEI